MTRVLEHSTIFLTVLFTVYSQLIMRWQVGLAGPTPEDLVGKAAFIFHLLLNPWVITGIVATFFAGVSWMLAMTRFEISYAFPFMSINYVLVLLSGHLLFGESISVSKGVGTLIIVIGVVLLASD